MLADYLIDFGPDGALNIIKPSGYNTGYGYLGTLPDGNKQLFTNETEYLEYLKEVES